MRDGHYRLIVSFVALGAIATGFWVGVGRHAWQARSIDAAHEVPAPTGNPTAQARAEFTLDGEVITYKLRMRKSIDDVFMAHIHLGEPGTAGPIVVWLFGNAPPTPSANTDFAADDVVASGTLKVSDFIGHLAGKSLDQIVDALDSGDYYVNVHTVRNQSGEIRGQISVDD
jgi:hypothetical protein